MGNENETQENNKEIKVTKQDESTNEIEEIKYGTKGDKKEEKNLIKEKESTEFFLYFIEYYFNGSSLNIELIESKNAKELEIVKEGISPNENNLNYIIYRVKILANTKKDSIKIKLISKLNKKYKAEIKLNELEYDTFYYDFNQFNDNSLNNNKSSGYNVSHLQQFKLFLNYIEESIHKEKRGSKIYSLVLSTTKLFIVKEKKEKDKVKKKEKELQFNEFSLFLLVFKECYERKIIIKFLSEFELNKVDKYKISKDLSLQEIAKIKLIFDNLENDPEIYLKYIEGKDNKMEKKIHIYYIIICFRLIFDKEKVLNSLNNILKNEDIQNIIYNEIINNIGLFEEIKFSKEHISKMVDISDTFIKIKNSLKFLVNISDLFEVISENFEHIISIINKELKEKSKKQEDFIFKIDIEMLKKTDDITKIYEFYNIILDKKKKKDIDNFNLFDPKFFERYISYFQNNNFEYLALLRNLMIKIINIIKAKVKRTKKEKKIKEEDENLVKYNNLITKINQIIHETGIYLSNKKKLTNIQILKFIKEDIEYIKNLKNKKEIEKTIGIFQGINMSKIDDVFIEEWKSFNFQYTLGNIKDNIINILNEKVSNFKEFDNLMKILNFSQKNNYMEFSQDSNNHFENSIIELILKLNIMKNLEEKISFNSMKNIYYKLCLMHQDKLTQQTKKEIANYLIKNTINRNIKILLEFAENFKFLCVNIFEGLIDKELQIEDILNIEENEKIILFKGLFERVDIINDTYKEIK